ncbi:alginate lyase family protein [Kordia sp. YSTF-M3]|uniref:Alginate lyase family protein n=1 Tax=Kordia aestuariivivens TaxID=2759037 RepID=A0ABR7Q9V0_9FLAO|nr:alginate lyase family protein [Kordia aestuariivivens]MBC8755340.1 alginate lyase family protein [Kordia aestuariivivens]
MNIKTILSKPLPVVWYRFVQLVKLKVYFKTKFWQKIEPKVHQKVSKSKKTWNAKSLLFTNDFSATDIPEMLQQQTISEANNIINGTISVFDVTYKFAQPISWNTDWRADYSWKNKYFKGYSFYEKNKAKEFDVKFPWELSRLSFLIPVARAYQLEAKKDQLAYIQEILSDWKTSNPIGFSVNWYPMEVSVRTINLIQLREILLEAIDTDEVVNLLNEILLLHGIFLWRNVEFTDIRGNHYSANLTALLLLGSAFKGFYAEAKTWYNYAVKRMEKEFHLQFIPDGVNFEKSISYHRLVVEFYLISFLVMQRAGLKLEEKTLKVLKNACEFTRDVTKPNQLTPIIGDNDSASVFLNDQVSLNDHTNMLQLASLFFQDEKLNTVNEKYHSAYEVFGTKATENLGVTTQNTFASYYYKEGGFVTVKDAQNYFITDVGEVGMKGRGGHGHNDLYSFELMLDGNDIIVDPGCYTYTGDLALKTKMKSTAYHNGLEVDGEEMAPMIGNWGISNIAQPFDVTAEHTTTKAIISGKHPGYQRLEDAVTHQRTFEIEKNSFKLTCTDVITCESPHKIARNLHFDEKIGLEIKENTIFIKTNNTSSKLTVDDFTTIRIAEYTFSANYGSKTTAKKVILETEIKGTTTVQFTIEEEKQF